MNIKMSLIGIMLLLLLPLPLPLPAQSRPSWTEILQQQSGEAYWQQQEVLPTVTREHLTAAIEAARTYYLNQQFKEGNFIYAFDIADGEYIHDDNQVRQAGALWGLACLNRDRFTEPTRRAVIIGIDFFLSNRKTFTSNRQIITYPGDERLKTGTVALFCLSLIDFLVGQDQYLPAQVKQNYLDVLDEHLRFLQSLELSDGSWAREYDIPSGLREQAASAYYDGEALLAYCKAARYLGRTHLIERIVSATPQLIRKYVTTGIAPGGNAEESKGFSQWGAMAFAEYVEAGWSDAEYPAQAAMAIAWWQIHGNKLEYRGGNVAYALEGLIASWRIARLRQDEKAMHTFRAVTERTLARLMLWQVGGPFADRNPFFKTLTRIPPKAHGGITAAADSGLIRIDNVQHQLHAMLLALNHFY